MARRMMDLPEEVLLMIVKLMDYNDICRLARLEFCVVGFKIILVFKSQHKVWQALRRSARDGEDVVEGGRTGWKLEGSYPLKG
jgi:hypothetical protein